MRRSEFSRQLPVDVSGARRGAAMSDYVAASMQSLRARQQTAAADMLEREHERRALEQRHAEHERDLRRRARQDYLSRLSRRERMIERLRHLRRLGLVWFAVSVMLAGCAIVAAAIAGASAVLGILGTIYISALLLGTKLVRARQDRLPPEHVERVHEQLDRVKASLPV